MGIVEDAPGGVPDLTDLVGELITGFTTGGEDGVVIIYTPVYELIIEPYFNNEGVQEGLEHTLSKHIEVDDA